MAAEKIDNPQFNTLLRQRDALIYANRALHVELRLSPHVRIPAPYIRSRNKEQDLFNALVADVQQREAENTTLKAQLAALNGRVKAAR